MFRLGIIEESLSDKVVFEMLAEYLHAERTESVEGDECPLWHVKEYRIPDEKMSETAKVLAALVKKTWYAHGFNEKELYVILHGKYFVLPPKRNFKWREMIRYGVKYADTDKKYLRKIPLHI